MMVIYSATDGKNITLSTRSPGSSNGGHVMPTYNSKIQATLMDGSGIANGVMTANIRCMCIPFRRSWTGTNLLQARAALQVRIGFTLASRDHKWSLMTSTQL
jgi:hypothetical protein